MRPVEEQMPILMQGVDYGDDQIRKNMEDELRERLKEGRPLRVYLGVDPSAPDIHLGHTVPIRKLRQFQEMGHDVTFLIGNFTGLVGDPSDKDKTRPMLSPEQLMANAKTYTDQAFKILDPQKTRIRYNAEWLSKLTFADVIKLASHFTVAQFLERDNFSKRFAKGDAIYLHEFFYALMQGYDAVAQETDVQVGGTDQLFNLLAGRVLQRAFNQRAADRRHRAHPGRHGRPRPHVQEHRQCHRHQRAARGDVRQGHEHPRLGHAQLLHAGHALHTGPDRGNSRPGCRGANPRDVKMELAREVVSIFHGEAAAEQAEANFITVFRQRDLPEDMPVFELTGAPNIVDLMSEAGLIQSKSEGRRLIQQGGVKLDGAAVSNVETRVEVTRDAVLQIGRRKFVRLVRGQS